MESQQPEQTNSCEAKYCDACGNSMLRWTEHGESNVIALAFSVGPSALAKEVLFPFEDREYNICYSCVLKSLGVPIPATV